MKRYSLIIFILIISSCAPLINASKSSNSETSVLTTSITPNQTLTPDRKQTIDAAISINSAREATYEPPEILKFQILSQEIIWPEKRPLPLFNQGKWIFSNIQEGSVTIEVIDKSEDLNTVFIETMNGKYLLTLSKGAILYLMVAYENWVDFFLFSPDVSQFGAPIDCDIEALNNDDYFCYWPPSVVQFQVIEGKDKIKDFSEDEGWCVNYSNNPESYIEISEELACNKYELPNGEIYEWTRTDCPSFELEVLED